MALQTIDSTTLKQWLERKEAVLVDVREPAEFKAQRIVGATSAPLSSLSCASLPEYAGKKLVLHCQKGRRGQSACEKLLAEKPDLELYNLAGGLTSWAEAGLPVESSDRFFLTVDRQTQLVIGLFVLTSSLLAYFVEPLFVWVAAFFGAGLIFAGLSGTCTLALLIAKMPWNRSKPSPNFCLTR